MATPPMVQHPEPFYDLAVVQSMCLFESEPGFRGWLSENKHRLPEARYRRISGGRWKRVFSAAEVRLINELRFRRRSDIYKGKS